LKTFFNNFVEKDFEKELIKTCGKDIAENFRTKQNSKNPKNIETKSFEEQKKIRAQNFEAKNLHIKTV
jgi:hypothetical protein